MNMSVAQLGGTQVQPPPSSQHTPHQHHSTRAPRTPESYFNVPESIALLNIVKSERIQSAFQSNRKNHASVWEMVADVLNRMSSRKRSAKQCCNRYENLKKIYTQLKKNPEKHVRRNWPYMYLFKEIEENRGECWGSNGKRALNGSNPGIKSELSYYHRRHAAALSMLINNPTMHKDTMALAAMAMNNGENLERFVANNFVETEMNEDGFNENDQDEPVDDDDSADVKMELINGNASNGERHSNSPTSFDKRAFAVNNYMKYEPSDDHEFSDINLMPVNYNNPSNYSFPSTVDPNILQPDVIVDTDNASQSSNESRRSKRKASSSSDTESTNFELIQYLKRREKRDEYMMKRMEEREERLLKLLERTVMAFEVIATKTVTTTLKNGVNVNTTNGSSSPTVVSPSQSPNYNTKNSFKNNN
ncbi:hypothetical protein ACFFRR_002622 [Megaselia abdita]